MSLLAGSWPHAMEQICAGRLSAADVPLREQATVVLYLVSPDYALRAGPAYEFPLDVERAAAQDCEVFFSSAVAAAPGSYRTVGTSPAVALATAADTLEQARARVASVAATVPLLEWRQDVGAGSYLEALRSLVDRSNRDATAAGDGGGARFVSNPG